MKISHKTLLSLIDYEMSTGIFTWKVAPSPLVEAGDIAGCVDRRTGYIYIRVQGRLYLAHRLAWFYVNRRWPTKQIDHIDGNKSNNLFENLRNISNQENQQNQRKAKKSNKAGLLGVVGTPSGKFSAFITVGGKTKRLGTFLTPDAAHAAYVQAKRICHAGCTI